MTPQPSEEDVKRAGEWIKAARDMAYGDVEPFLSSTFAAVRAEEREACAKIVEGITNEASRAILTAMIRARGKATNQPGAGSVSTNPRSPDTSGVGTRDEGREAVQPDPALLSVRDRFAMAALASILMRGEHLFRENDAAVAERAYEWADEMMRARTGVS